MYDPLWKAVAPHLAVERMKADVAAFFELSRWSSFDKINDLARLIATKMEEIGLQDVRLIGHPADGKTAFGGWVMPRAYDVEAARLSLALNDDSRQLLADYQLNPTSLMIGSMSTPDGGIIAELVVADDINQCDATRLAGRLVLTSCGSVEFSQAAMRACAVGIVCDGRFGRRFIKDGPSLDETNEWHNYTIPPWADSAKGFGFSISPALGGQLRARVQAGERVRMHALVKSRHYDGVLPVVSGLLPGILAEEIVLCGHYDECGADDNCSQVAVGLEVMRAIRALIDAGEIPPLTRGIRLLFPMEVRGFNALVQDPEETKNMRLGLNIDTVGTDQNAATTLCTLVESFAAFPSFAEELLAELLGRIVEENPLFRWRRVGADVIDNVFGEPLIGAPTPCLYHYSATHHLPLDTPDRISGRMLFDMARLTTTYAAFVANAGLDETRWLSELTADTATGRLHETATHALRNPANVGYFPMLLRQVDALHESYEKRLRSTRWMVPATDFLPSSDWGDGKKSPFVGENRLLPHEFYDGHLASLQERVRRSHAESATQIQQRQITFHQNPPTSPVESLPGSRCVPVKAFRGFLAFEDLSVHEREEVTQMGIEAGWGAPVWLQEALMFANGKRTASEITLLLQRHCRKAPDVPQLERVFEFLSRRGLVRLRPYLSHAEIRNAIEQAGLQRGDAVLAHFSLSRFGYMEGGAEELIDNLLDLLGADGTLMMPTFSFSWMGRAPFNPAQTASRVGTVTDHFWRRSSVQRSLHPTHSFAAIGPLASSLLAGHDYTQPPLGEHSPIIKLAKVGGKILLFAPKKSNTSMHIGEYLAGVPFVDLLCPIIEDGVRREVVVPRCPWHVQFALAYEKLSAQGQLREVTLGESFIYTMLCRDAIDAQAAVARETPQALLQPGCNCPYCQILKQFCHEHDQIA